MTVEDVARGYWSAIDAADWSAMAEFLHDDFVAEYPATRETFDKAAYVRFNAEYPGRWHATVLEIVSADDRVVTRARVADGNESHLVASFASVHDGRITRLVEIWAEEGVPPPADRRPSRLP